MHPYLSASSLSSMLRNHHRSTLNNTTSILKEEEVMTRIETLTRLNCDNCFDDIDVSTSKVSDDCANDHRISIASSIARDDEGFVIMLDNHLREADFYGIGQDHLFANLDCTSTTKNQVKNIACDSMVIMQRAYF